MSKKILIVGGVAGGASAACRLRRLDENAHIVMFERDEYISFANCGLPYHISEVIEKRNALIVQTPAAMHRRFRIDIRNFSEVTAVDTAAKQVTVNSLEKGVYQEDYDVLVISPGAEPFVPDFPGNDSQRIFTLRNLPDMDRIKAIVDHDKPASAVVVGGGFIGLEMAENLREKGIGVTLVEAADHVMPPLDGDMACILEKELDKNGVKLVLGDGLKSITDEETASVVETVSGRKITAEMIILAIGVRPATAFLQGSGIELGPKGHIIVDDQMRTNAADVYAVGDAVQVKDFVSGDDTAVPLAGPANKQGRIVADVICGLDAHYKATQGTSILKAFGLTAACTGLNERALKAKGIKYLKACAHPFNHATYYPGATTIESKLLFDEKGTILGCQMVGRSGVDKRVDVIATVMRLGGNVRDLPELELAYAPPFASAKDPVNMLGYIATNVLDGTSKLVDWEYALNRDPETTILLDVRTPQEYAAGHVEGAINIPVDDLRERLDELDPDKEIIEYCKVGLRAHIAYRILANNGFDARNVTGGWMTYEQMNFKPQN
ncbi:MAG: FAD-dependent oxidoreductase [Oscillospiraceae bacterium]|nr:FAD-dependent oxidoreductase [Oscillospiraceae bacterium]